MRAKADFILNWPTLTKNGKIDLDGLTKIVQAWWQSTNITKHELSSHPKKRRLRR
jgi:hypothetical protein